MDRNKGVLVLIENETKKASVFYTLKFMCEYMGKIDVNFPSYSKLSKMGLIESEGIILDSYTLYKCAITKPPKQNKKGRIE